MEANIKMITIHGAVCVGEEPTEANIKMITIDGAVSVTYQKKKKRWSCVCRRRGDRERERGTDCLRTKLGFNAIDNISIYLEGLGQHIIRNGRC